MKNFEAIEEKIRYVDYEKVSEKIKEILKWRDTLTEDEIYKTSNYHLIRIGEELLEIQLLSEIYGVIDIERKKGCEELIKKHIARLVKLGYDTENIAKEG